MDESGSITNGVVVTGGAHPEIFSPGSVTWRNGRIFAVGGTADVEPPGAGAEVLDARGGLILPGFVNLHHHFYSALARGLDPGTTMSTFPEVLDRLWWRLDRALDPETVLLSAELTLADCVRWGCTTVFDHHASPSCIDGSLDLIAGACETAGVSALLCYEITDRNGHDQALAGLEENLRFLSARRDDSRVRGIIGLHASFTLRDRTLEAVAARRPQGTGVHVHMAEDPVDVRESRSAFGLGPRERLERFGVLDRHSLLAHGIHLETEDYDAVARAGATIVHNPESNANNGVGRLDVAAVARKGCRIGLGTDGMASSMPRALKAAFLHLRGESRDPSAGFEGVPDLLWNNALVAREFFEEPLLGELTPGAPADLVTVDQPPPTPLDPGNQFGHLVFGVAESPVRHTVARGRILMRDFRLQAVDPESLAERGRRSSPGLWKRFRGLEWGTEFLGP